MGIDAFGNQLKEFWPDIRQVFAEKEELAFVIQQTARIDAQLPTKALSGEVKHCFKWTVRRVTRSCAPAGVKFVARY